MEDEIRDLLRATPNEWERSIKKFASTDAGKLAMGTLGVWALWRLALPAERNQIPDTTKRHHAND